MLQQLERIFRPAAEHVDVEIKRLAEREQALLDERQAKARELAAIEASIGEDYLDRREARVVELTRLRSEIEAIAWAIEAARRRQLEAVRSKYRAKAEELRRLAGEKQAELDALNTQTGKLLRDLAELEGVDYDHSILSAQRCGGWFGPDFRAPQEWMGPADVAPDPVTGRYQTPLSRRLRAEIEALLAEAAKIEAAEQATLEAVPK